MKVSNFEYEIDHIGNVKSIKSGKVISPYLANGYYKVDLYRNSKRRKVYVHQLVGECYHPDSWFVGAIINHKDGNRLNNHRDNIEWVTPSENIKHSYIVLGRKCPPRLRGSESIHAIKVNMVDKSTGSVLRTFGCIKDAISVYGSGVEKCLHKKRKSAHGFKWQYA